MVDGDEEGKYKLRINYEKIRGRSCVNTRIYFLTRETRRERRPRVRTIMSFEKNVPPYLYDILYYVTHSKL